MTMIAAGNAINTRFMLKTTNSVKKLRGRV
jgi:hypothetical protein